MQIRNCNNGMTFFSIITFVKNNQVFWGNGLMVHAVLCKSNANKICWKSSFVLANFPWKIVIFRKIALCHIYGNYLHLFSIRFNGFYCNKKKTKLSKTNPVSQTTAALLQCTLQFAKKCEFTVTTIEASIQQQKRVTLMNCTAILSSII